MKTNKRPYSVGNRLIRAFSRIRTKANSPIKSFCGALRSNHISRRLN